MLWHHVAVAPRGDGNLSHDLLPGEKGPQDACGVFGVFAPGEEVAKLTYFGLYALQHRGQESAGIAASDGTQIMVFVYSFAVGGASGKATPFPNWALNPTGNPDYCMRLT